MGEANRVKQFGLQARVNHGQPQQVQIDLSKATQRLCTCGCQYFTQAVTVHIISALISPTGQELTAQVPVLLCMECNAVLPLGKKEE